MNRIVLAVLLAAATLAGCAQLQGQPRAEAGATAAEQARPYPKSSSDLGLF
jgi:hypothetical protein